jgi:hypothetical protein
MEAITRARFFNFQATFKIVLFIASSANLPKEAAVVTVAGSGKPVVIKEEVPKTKRNISKFDSME